MKKILLYILMCIIVCTSSACRKQEMPEPLTETAQDFISAENTAGDAEESVITETDEEALTARLERYREEGFPAWFCMVLRDHFNVETDDEITDEMLAQIKEVDISLQGTASMYITDVRINDSPISCVLSPYLSKQRFKSYMEKLDEWPIAKMSGLYTYRDKDDPELTLNGLNRMLENYPIVAERPVYVLDHEIKAREKRELMVILVEQLMDEMVDGMLEDGVMNLETLELLPNLEKVTCTLYTANVYEWKLTVDADLKREYEEQTAGLEGYEYSSKMNELYEKAKEEFTDEDYWDFYRAAVGHDIYSGYLDLELIRD